MTAETPQHPPIVDLSDFDARRPEIVKDLMAAATGIGFFYISNSGIPQHLIDAAFSQAARCAPFHHCKPCSFLRCPGIFVNRVPEKESGRESTCRNTRVTYPRRFFSLPQDTKESFPKVDWASSKVIGYEVNSLTGEQQIVAVVCLDVNNGLDSIHRSSQYEQVCAGRCAHSHQGLCRHLAMYCNVVQGLLLGHAPVGL